MSIDWGSFFLVAGVAIVAAVVLSGAYAGGVRLLSVARGPDGARGASGAMAGAVACFGVCVAVVLLGLWLVIPQLH